jgi:hypothetical protein
MIVTLFPDDGGKESHWALDWDTIFTQLLNVEGFIKFNLRESIKLHYKTSHTIGINGTEAEIVLLNSRIV